MATPDNIRKLSINNDARAMLVRARQEGHRDRMGPARGPGTAVRLLLDGRQLPELLDGTVPRRSRSAKGPQKGVCGADADIIVARNLGRTIAAGRIRPLGPWPRHPRGVHGPGRTARPPATRFAAKTSSWPSPPNGVSRRTDRPVQDVARDLADAMMEDFGSRKEEIGFLDRVPEVRRKLWSDLGITPRGIDRENVEMLHRTHMGVDNDYVNTLLHAHAHEPVRRLGRLDDRDRAVGRHVRHAEAGRVARQPRRAARGPREHRAARSQPACCPT